MDTLLFYPESIVRESVLRAAALHEVEKSRLISEAAFGSHAAIEALHIGFWPFVQGFEEAIDMRARELFPQRRHLVAKFGGRAVKATLTSLAHSVRQMKNEEGSHAAIWESDAKSIGIKTLAGPVAHGVEQLIESALESDLWKHYCVLAGTEYIAEELSARLSRRSTAFTVVFPRKKWAWGEVHLLPHENGPSHRQIDEDLARALCDFSTNAKARAELESAILATIRLFGKAADDVYDLYLKPKPRLRLAA